MLGVIRGSRGEQYPAFQGQCGLMPNQDNRLTLAELLFMFVITSPADSKL